MNSVDGTWDEMIAALDQDREVWEVAASLFLEDEDEQRTDTSGSPLTLSPKWEAAQNDVSMHVKQEETPLPTSLTVQVTPDGVARMTSTAAASTTPTNTTRRVNRRRQEILFLREQVQELEQRLRASQLRIRQSEEFERSLDPLQSELLGTAWAAVAAQQREQRHLAEAEHDRLVHLLDEQRRLAKALQRFARRTQIQEVPAPLAVYAHLQQLHESTALTTATSFEELQLAMLSMYEQRNAVFADERFDSVLSSFRDFRVVNTHTPRVCIELMDARIEPFSVKTTADAVWQSMVNRVTTTVTYNNEAFEATNDVIKKGFVAAVELPNHGHTSMRGRVVAQRIIEPDRVVILRATLFEPVSVSTGEADTFSVRHYQWTVIEAPHHARLRNNSHALAQIQSLDLSFPKVLAGIESHVEPPQQEDVMVHFCREAGSYHLDLSRQSVENLLVSSSSSAFHTVASHASIKLEAC